MGPMTPGMSGFDPVASALGVANGVMGFIGQENTNAANIQMQGTANAANMAEAEKARGFAADQSQRNRDFQSIEARNQTQFQERMSNTAYQRATEDMKKAGINPMLAFSQGGASSQSGAAGSGSQASASVGRAEAARVGNSLAAGSNSAMDTMKLVKDLRTADSTMALQEASKGAAEAKRELDTNNAKTAGTNAKMAEARLPAVRAQSKTDKKQAEIDETMAYPDAIGSRLIKLMGLGNSAKDLISPSGPKLNLNMGRVIKNGRKTQSELGGRMGIEE